MIWGRVTQCLTFAMLNIFIHNDVNNDNDNNDDYNNIKSIVIVYWP